MADIKPVRLQTFLPDKELLVSTARRVGRVGDPVAETLVFRTDRRGNVLSWDPVYAERYPLDMPEEELQAAHERVVERTRAGELEGLAAVAD
ncbi:MAG TPA: hypothetical protein VIK99_07285 [Thermaerobacter sp.]